MRTYRNDRDREQSVTQAERPFLAPAFEEWEALDGAMADLGHGPQVRQGVIGWLLVKRQGLRDSSSAPTRSRYRKILASVQSSYRPAPRRRRKTFDEAYSESTVVYEAAEGAGRTEKEATEIASWYLSKLVGEAHEPGSLTAAQCARAVVKLGFSKPSPEMVEERDWSEFGWADIWPLAVVTMAMAAVAAPSAAPLVAQLVNLTEPRKAAEPPCARSAGVDSAELYTLAAHRAPAKCGPDTHLGRAA